MRIRARTKRKRLKAGGTHKKQHHKIEKHHKTEKHHNKKNKIVKGKLTKGFKALNCSPENNKNKQFTCFSDDDLHKLRSMWNARHPDLKIDSNNSREIWHILKNNYASVCNKESCWIKQIAKGSKMEKELMDSFAPESPEEWKKIRPSGYPVWILRK